jgi:uncharacterized membrane protein YcaP (DUF421 family)
MLLLDNNGLLSVKKKEQYLTITRNDLNIYKSEVKMPVELIMDREILEKNTLEWLLAALAKRKLNVDNVVYALLTSNQKLYIDTHNDQLQSPLDVE